MESRFYMYEVTAEERKERRQEKRERAGEKKENFSFGQ